MLKTYSAEPSVGTKWQTRVPCVHGERANEGEMKTSSGILSMRLLLIRSLSLALRISLNLQLAVSESPTQIPTFQMSYSVLHTQHTAHGAPTQTHGLVNANIIRIHTRSSRFRFAVIRCRRRRSVSLNALRPITVSTELDVSLATAYDEERAPHSKFQFVYEFTTTIAFHAKINKISICRPCSLIPGINLRYKIMSLIDSNWVSEFQSKVLNLVICWRKQENQKQIFKQFRNRFCVHCVCPVCLTAVLIPIRRKIENKFEKKNK